MIMQSHASAAAGSRDLAQVTGVLQVRLIAVGFSVNILPEIDRVETRNANTEEVNEIVI